MRLASYKLRYLDTRVRAVPKTDLQGCAFKGPGVDLLGDEARAALGAATPIVGVLREFEPELVLRSLSVALDARRVLATFEDRGGARPRVVSLSEGAALERILGASAKVEPHLVEAVKRVLARRKTEP